MTRIEEIREHQKADEALEEKYGVKLTSIADRAYLLSELDEAVRLLRQDFQDAKDRAALVTFLTRYPEAK